MASDPSAVVPLIVSGELWEGTAMHRPYVSGEVEKATWSQLKRFYYFWFFGCVAKLPFETSGELDPPPQEVFELFNECEREL